MTGAGSPKRLAEPERGAGEITRRIELARQIEEMRLLHSQQSTELPALARRTKTPAGVVTERLQRQAAIIRTLEWNQQHEAEIRAWIAEKKGQANG